MIEDIENSFFYKQVDIKNYEISQNSNIVKYDLNKINCKVLETKKVKGFLLLHVAKGSGNFKLDLENYKITNYTIYFAYPGQLFSNLNFRNTTGYILYLTPEFLFKTLPNFINMKLFQLYGDRHEITLTEELSSELFEIASIIDKELASIEYRKNEIIQNLLNLHTYKLDRFFYQKHLHIENTAPPKVREFFTLLNLKDNINLKVKDYAWELNLSPNYLNVLIKKHTGSSIKSIIKEKTIRQACVYLIHSDFSIKEIAYQLGYSYPQYFDRDFKNTIGITPIQYRSSNR